MRYVDQDVGAAGSTGRGEENIRVAGGHTIVENMRHGMEPKNACLDALKRVARNFGGNMTKLAQFDLKFYALRKDGAYAGASLWSGTLREGRVVPSQFAVNDGGTSRHEPAPANTSQHDVAPCLREFHGPEAGEAGLRD